GDFTKSYDEAVKKLEASQNTTFITRRSPPPLSITPAQARFTGPYSVIGDIAVLANGSPWTLPAAGTGTLNAGDLVRIDVAGQWAPTCAIGAYSATPPAALPPYVVSTAKSIPIKPT